MALVELAACAASEVPEHWRRAPLPGAALYRRRGARLEAIDRDEALLVDAACAAQLDEPAAGALVARHGPAIWRLRPCAAGVREWWLAQPLAHSRERLLRALRTQLAERLAAQILHELRNPMNALSLHADLLGRLLAAPDAADKAAASLRVVRERLNDLSARQNAVVARWLAPPADGAQELELAVVLAGLLRMLRSHFSLHEVAVRTPGLEALGGQRVRADAALELVLVAVLLLACDTIVAGTRGTGEIVVEAEAAPAIRVRVRAPFAAQAAAPGFDGGAGSPTQAEFADILALLLDDCGARLALAGQDLEVHFAAG